MPLCASTPRASNEARTRQFFVYLSNLDEEENHIGVKLSNIRYDTSNMGAMDLVLDVNIDDDLSWPWIMYHLLKYLEDPEIFAYDTKVWKKTTSRRSGWIQMPRIVADGGEDLDHQRVNHFALAF